MSETAPHILIIAGPNGEAKTMNPLSIEQAQNADLRGSYPALRRAAQRAREIARQTGTCLVYGEPDGTVAQITPDELDRIETAWADEAKRRLST